METKNVLLLIYLSAQLSNLAKTQDDFVTVYNSLREIAKIYKKYTNRDLNITPSFVRNLIRPLPFPENGPLRRNYDFILVGCGSAGSVIANRLSENPNWNILVLEAGKTENMLSRIPLLVPVLSETGLAWDYQMEVDPGFGKGVQKQLISWSRGKALGGSSVINYMIYSRGSPLDYDIWAQKGNPGWSYKEVLPYFLKSEAANLKHENPHYHNTTGEISVEEPYQSFPLMHAFIKAGFEMGYDSFADYNSKNMFGFAPIQATLLNGRRHTTARAFLHPVRNRPNLHILTEAHVTKIMIEDRTKKAYGVRYIKNKTEYEVYASKEIILSGGALNTPQILMLSGIGPQKDLQELGIQSILNLPAVGKNLYDHILYYGLNFVMKEPIGLNPIKVLNPLTFKAYQQLGVGPLASLGGMEAVAFIKTNHTEVQPDIELQLTSGSLATDLGIIYRRSYAISDKTFDAYWGHLTKKNTFTILVVLQRPKSSGFVKLRSKHPLIAPLFYGNYLSDPERYDLNTIIAGIRFCVDLTKTDSFKRYGIRLDETPVPGCKRFEFGSDKYWECAIRTFSYTNFHMMGTAKMGRDGDDSVVDSELRVHGIEGLRVADMSIAPIPLVGHLNAQAIMIGEKASDIIKKSWDEENTDDYDYRDF